MRDGDAAADLSAASCRQLQAGHAAVVPNVFVIREIRLAEDALSSIHEPLALWGRFEKILETERIRSGRGESKQREAAGDQT